MSEPAKTELNIGKMQKLRRGRQYGMSMYAVGSIKEQK